MKLSGYSRWGMSVSVWIGSPFLTQCGAPAPAFEQNYASVDSTEAAYIDDLDPCGLENELTCDDSAIFGDPGVDPLFKEGGDGQYPESVAIDSGDGSGGSVGGGSVPPASDQGESQASDSFQQASPANDKLDLLLVVDNSGSMLNVQQKLANLEPLMDFIKDADWRLAVTTTDASESSLRLFLSKADTSNSFETKKQIFNDTIRQIGTNGSGNERGILMSINGFGMKKPSTQMPWTRDSSLLANIIVSDENNCSTGLNCQYGPQDLANFYTNFMGRQLGTSARTYAIVRRDAAECASIAPYVGSHYTQAVSLIGGLSEAICADNYNPVLAAISADISVQLQRSFTLSHVPINESVVVRINDLPYQGGFQISGKTIQLLEAPSSGSSIVVSYSYLRE